MKENTTIIMLYLIGIISLIYLVIYQLILIHIPAPYTFFPDLGIIINILAQGIFAGWAIYVLIDIHSKYENWKKLKRIIPLSMKGFGHKYQSPIMRLMQCVNIEEKHLFTDIEENWRQLNDINTRQEIFMDLLVGGSTIRKTYDGLYEYAKCVSEMCDELLKYSAYIDDITFHYLIEFRNCDYLKNVILRFNKETMIRDTGDQNLGYNLGSNSIKEYIRLGNRLHKRIYDIKAGLYI